MTAFTPIKREHLNSDALRIVLKLQEQKHTTYLVGGCVRDLLLGLNPKDYDIATSATPQQVRKVFRRTILVGHRFPLAHVRCGSKFIEVATFRAGNDEDKLIERDNTWGSAEQDALRRDFTINALFYDPHREQIIDYVDGCADLQKGLLRVIGSPEKRFRQDPMRMLRLVKFRARLGLTVDPTTEAALLKCRSQIRNSSQVRLLEEVLRMLESGSASPSLAALHHWDIIPFLWPKIAKDIEAQLSEILSLLAAADRFPCKRNPCHRPLWMSCFLYPLAEKIPVGKLVHSCWQELPCPKRWQGISIAILAWQQRFLESYPAKPPRFFPLALALLRIRSELKPTLRKLHKTWALWYQRVADKISTKSD